MKTRVSFLAFISALMLIACGSGDDVPLSTAPEVKAAFDIAPPVLESWYGQNGTARGEVMMTQYPVDFTLAEPFRLVVAYKGKTVYDERHWLITERHAVMQDGTDVVLLTEYGSRVSHGSSVVFVDGVMIPKLQSLPARISDQDYPQTVHDIREWQNGWLLIFATTGGRGYDVRRWAMYHPKTQEFIDCGEFGSSRHSDWGPAASSVCQYR